MNSESIHLFALLAERIVGYMADGKYETVEYITFPPANAGLIDSLKLALERP